MAISGNNVYCKLAQTTTPGIAAISRNSIIARTAMHACYNSKCWLASFGPRVPLPTYTRQYIISVATIPRCTNIISLCRLHAVGRFRPDHSNRLHAVEPLNCGTAVIERVSVRRPSVDSSMIEADALEIGRNCCCE